MTTLLSSIWQNLTRHGLVLLCLFVVLLWKCYKQRCEIRNLRNENLYFKDLINKVIMPKHQKIIINYNHGHIIYNGDMDHPVFNYGNETDAWYSFNSRRLNSKLTQYANRYLYIMVKRQ